MPDDADDSLAGRGAGPVGSRPLDDAGEVPPDRRAVTAPGEVEYLPAIKGERTDAHERLARQRDRVRQVAHRDVWSSRLRSQSEHCLPSGLRFGL